MSKQSLDQVIQRASSDARFRDSLNDNFDGAIRSYDLTDDERAQLAKGLGLSAAATARAMPSSVAAHMEAATMNAATSEAATSEAATSEAATSEAATSEAATSEAATSEAATSEAATSEAATSEANTVEGSAVNLL
jgi:hypothetical protein